MFKKGYRSYREYQKEFFPDRLLDRLAETLASELKCGPNKLKYTLSKRKDDPKKGRVQVDRPKFLFRSVEKIIERFYEEEGYDIIEGHGDSYPVSGRNRPILVSKESERYLILPHIGLGLGSNSIEVYVFRARSQ